MKTALVGLGRIGWGFHLEQILSHKDFDLCAVADPDRKRLAEAQERYGVQVYTDFRQMLAQAHPELVVIATPTVFHEEQAIAAMEAGADVLLEKPMAMDAAEASRIAEVKERTGRKLVVYQPRRFSEEILAAGALMASGKLGDIYQIRVSRCTYTRRDDWQALRQFGGGILSNYGAHYIDVMVSLCDSQIVDCYCQTQKILSLGDAEDVARIFMRTETGQLMDIDINQATPISGPTVALYGTLGAAEARTDETGKYFYVRYCDSAQLQEKTVCADLAAPDRKYPKENIQWKTEKIPFTDYPALDFYGACADYFGKDGPSPVPLDQTLTVMKLLDRCRQQAEKCK